MKVGLEIIPDLRPCPTFMRSPDPRGCEMLVGIMHWISDVYLLSGWAQGIEMAVWDIAIAGTRRSMPSAVGDGEEDVEFEPELIDQLRFIERWTEGWVLHVSPSDAYRTFVQNLYPFLSPDHCGAIYLPRQEWLAARSMIRDGRGRPV